jgi:hypothetical protein
MSDLLESDIRFSIVPEWVLDAGLSDRAVRVYALIARYADNDTLQAFPARETLADRALCSVKSIDRAVRELVAAGALRKAHRRNGDSYQSNLYTVRRIPDTLVTRVSPSSDSGVTRVGTGESPGGATGVPLTITTELEPNNDIGKKAKQVPADWQPDEKLAAELNEKFPTLSLDDEVSAFVDYGQAKGATYKDFNAAFRNWCRNSVKFHGPKTVIHQQPASKSPYVGGPREWVRDMHDMGEHFECREGEFGCK